MAISPVPWIVSVPALVNSKTLGVSFFVSNYMAKSVVMFPSFLKVRSWIIP